MTPIEKLKSWTKRNNGIPPYELSKTAFEFQNHQRTQKLLQQCLFAMDCAAMHICDEDDFKFDEIRKLVAKRLFETEKTIEKLLIKGD